MQPATKRHCPYLSTIKRHLLDFDFEKLCSVTLSNLNVYACLICGVYYSGRGKNTHAYIHSLELNHHVFINLQTTKVYCLPDNYEIDDVSLEDIKYNLKPFYTPEQIALLDKNEKNSRSLTGVEFCPGFLGMNNIKANDYANVILQGLCRVGMLRDYLMQTKFSNDTFDLKTILVQRFAELIKKIWNPKNFKGHVSPHELLQVRKGKTAHPHRAATRRNASGPFGLCGNFFIFFLQGEPQPITVKL